MELLHHYVADISDAARPEVENSAQSTAIHPEAFPRDATTVPVPVQAGDVLLFHGLTPHRSGSNSAPPTSDGGRSDESSGGAVRWAADIRYHAPGAGNCFPAEASFLARSADPSNPALVSDWREYLPSPFSFLHVCTHCGHGPQLTEWLQLA